MFATLYFDRMFVIALAGTPKIALPCHVVLQIVSITIGVNVLLLKTQPSEIARERMFKPERPTTAHERFA
eukprot:6199190-Pleurochrysis_carterae.AAC.1